METAHLQRTLQGRNGRPGKMKGRGQEKAARQVQNPLYCQRNPRRMQAVIEPQTRQAGSVQALVAMQKLRHSAGTEAETAAQILHAALAESPKVVGDGRGLAGEVDRGEEHG